MSTTLTGPLETLMKERRVSDLALEALAKIQEPEELALVACQHEEPYIRLCAASRLHPISQRQALEEIGHNDPDFDVRHAALTLLGR